MEIMSSNCEVTVKLTISFCTGDGTRTHIYRLERPITSNQLVDSSIEINQRIFNNSRLLLFSDSEIFEVTVIVTIDLVGEAGFEPTYVFFT